MKYVNVQLLVDTWRLRSGLRHSRVLEQAQSSLALKGSESLVVHELEKQHCWRCSEAD
jgi:hypothetical protein